MDKFAVPQQNWLEQGIPAGFWYRHSQVRILPPQPAISAPDSTGRHNSEATRGAEQGLQGLVLENMRPIAALAMILILMACGSNGSGTEPGGHNVQASAAGNAELEEAAAGDPAAGEAGDDAARGNDQSAGMPTPAPVANGNLAWFASTTSRGHKLTYGRPQTDDVRATLRCAEGGKVTVQVSPSKQSDGPGAMRLLSGGATQQVAVEVAESMLGGMIVSGDVGRDAQVLKNFRAGQPLSLSWGPHTVTVPAGSGEIATFFERCS